MTFESGYIDGYLFWKQLGLDIDKKMNVTMYLDAYDPEQVIFVKSVNLGEAYVTDMEGKMYVYKSLRGTNTICNTNGANACYVSVSSLHNNKPEKTHYDNIYVSLAYDNKTYYAFHSGTQHMRFYGINKEEAIGKLLKYLK